MPAEWSEHQRTFISWPVQASMCYPEDYEAVCRGYEEIIHAIAEFEPVTVILNQDDSKIADRFLNMDGVEYLFINHNDAWLRDNGPTFLKNDKGELTGVNWHFNAWGGKYSSWDLDDDLAPKILERTGVKCFNAPLVMEGGSIHVDGEGTMITTEECLLNPNRNPELSREQIEDYLQKYLGIEKVIWLKRGLSGDETDGHVDNIACFGAPGKIIMQVCDDPGDENYHISRENLQILKETRDARGRELEIKTIPQPPLVTYKDRRLTLSYLNFYFVNGGIILPIFGGSAEAADHLAVSLLSENFPSRRVRTVNGMAVIREGGNVHCLTQQMPAGTIK
jgi:agmatine deiminase